MTHLRMHNESAPLPAQLLAITHCLRTPFTKLLIVALALQGAKANASEDAFLDFVKTQAAELRAGDQPPTSLTEWQQLREAIRNQLLSAWGGIPKEAVPLKPQLRGTLQREGYRVEKLIFQTLPDIWMTRHLKNKGDGSPIPEPEMETEDPETLRCFPGESRPDDWMTIPRFAAREGRKLAQRVRVPDNAGGWQDVASRLRRRLDRDLLGGTKPKPTAPRVASRGTSPQHTLEFEPEPGVRLTATRLVGKRPQRPGTVIVLSLDGEAKPTDSKLAMAVHQSEREVVSLGLRATGEHAYSRDKIGRAPDHNTAEWSLWLGRPLLGQWVLDVRAALNVLEADSGPLDRLTVVGAGPAGVVAVCAAALDSRIQQVVTVGSLASFVSESPYENQRLGIIVPGIVRDVGDIPHLAALVAPRKLVIAGGVNGKGESLDEATLKKQFKFTSRVYALEQASGKFTVLPDGNVEEFLRQE